MADEGKSNQEIAEVLKTTEPTIIQIKKRYCQDGLGSAINQTARGHPTLKDGVCFGPRALVSRISETSELRFPGSDHQNNCVSAFDCMIALLINLKKT